MPVMFRTAFATVFLAACLAGGTAGALAQVRGTAGGSETSLHRVPPVPDLLGADGGSGAVRSAGAVGALDRTDGAVAAGAHAHADGSSHTEKCAVPHLLAWERYRLAVEQNPDLRDPAMDEGLALLDRQTEQLLAEAAGQTAYTSPSGKFVLFYETTGTHAVNPEDADGNGVPDYVERAGESADSSYRYMVRTLGYPDPIEEGSTYSITFRNMSYYGYTSTSGNGTVISVHSDFDGFPPNDHPDGDQIGALYATIAHEFKHAIQYRTNRWRGEAGEFDWVEMDATMMEEVVYDDVNDYYNYLGSGSIFRSPQNATPGAYSHVTWSLYFSETRGPGFWKRVWDQFLEISGKPFLDAVEDQLLAEGGSLEHEHLMNHLWHLTSGDQFPASRHGFDERAFYPNARLSEAFESIPDSSLTATGVAPFAARYVSVRPGALRDGNVRLQLAGDRPGIGAAVRVWFTDGTEEERILLPSAVESTLDVRTSWPWERVEALAAAVVNFSAQSGTYTARVESYIPESMQLAQNYPNPFNPTTTIAFELDGAETVTLRIFDSAGREIRSLASGRYPAGRHTVVFDARGLASGVYFYRLEADSGVRTRSMVLLR